MTREADIILGRIAIALVGWHRLRDIVGPPRPARALDACLDRNIRAMEREQRRLWWTAPWRAVRRRLAVCAPTCTLWRYNHFLCAWQLKLWPHPWIGDWEPFRCPS